MELLFQKKAFMGNSRKVFQCQEARIFSSFSFRNLLYVSIFGSAVLVALHRLSLAGVRGGYCSLWCMDSSLWWLLSFQFAGSEQGLSSCGTQA